MPATFQMTDVLGEVFEVVRNSFDDLDTDGVDAARFVTHLRFFFVRVRDKKQIKRGTPPYSSAVIEAYPRAHHCAQRVALLLEMRLGHPISAEEIVYLTMHIARLADDG